MPADPKAPSIKKQDFGLRRVYNTEPFPQKSKPKPGASTPTTRTTNSGIEILDLVTNEEDPYSQNRAGNMRNTMIQSKRTTTNFKPLIKKPIYSYSSKEVPDLSLVGFGRSLSCHNQEPPTPLKSPQHSPNRTSPTPADYDEAGIDLFMASLVGVVPSAQSATGSGVYGLDMTLPSSPPELVPGFPVYMDGRPSHPEYQSPSVNGSSTNNWQTHKPQPPRPNPHGSSNLENNATEKPCGDTDILPGVLPSIRSISNISYSQRKIAKSSDRSRGIDPLFKGVLTRKTRSGHGDMVLSGDYDVCQKRKDPFTSQRNGQEKRNSMQAHGKTVYDDIASTSKESAKVDVGNTGGLHQLTYTRKPEQEIPMNVLDFLGGCVSYAGDVPTPN